jgi:hypothetical protein
MKKDVKEVIQGEEPHLNNLLSPEDLSSFKGFEQKQKHGFLYYRTIDIQLKHQSIGNVLENNLVI